MIMGKFKIAFIVAVVLAVSPWKGLAQTMSVVEENYNRLTNEWLEISGQLKSYKGLSEYCQDAALKSHTGYVLGTIHRYDSVLLAQINDPSSNLRSKDAGKILKEIEAFERKHSMQDFNAMFVENCADWRKLERTKSRTYSASGVHSYDSQVLNLEMILYRYLNRIDKKLISLEDHLDFIHPHHAKSLDLVLLTQKQSKVSHE
jgi:hypothetical protein